MMLVILSATLAASVVLATIGPGMFARGNRETVQKVERIVAALRRYSAQNGAFPADLTELVDGDAGSCVLVNDPGLETYGTLQGWCGPYLYRDFLEDPDGFQRDGWGTRFSYPGGTALLSAGPDRQWGTADDLTF